MNDAADPIYPDQSLDIGCRRYGAGEHHIAPQSIPPEAVWVYRELREAGFEAYLVGGCVRDLLLGYEPKDFDVSTNATPEEIRDIFRRSRIVGRRFQIVHVRSGREVIEVSTFRGHHSAEFEPDSEDEQPPEGSASYAESGMLLRDNVFGNVEEDALRRDFSVNGLYYDPDANCVLDFSTGYVQPRPVIHRRALTTGLCTGCGSRWLSMSVCSPTSATTVVELEPQAGGGAVMAR